MSNLKKKFQENKLYGLFLIMLGACAICQLILTFYFTAFQGQEHMGIDASWEYLKGIVAAKEGSLYPASVMHGTTHPEFERMILVLPFYKLIGNIFVAYSLSNLIFTLISILLISIISENFKFNMSVKLLLINMFLCPYLANGYKVANELGYHESVNGFAAYYNVLIIAFFLILLYFTGDECNKKISWLGILTCFVIAYVAMCKGMGIFIWVGLPIILFLLIQMFVKNDIKVFTQTKSIYLILFVAAMFVGRIIGGILGFEYLDSDSMWVNAGEFMKNLGNLLLGFPLMLGGIPDAGITRNPASLFGFVYCFGIVISFVLYLAVIYWLVMTVKKAKESETMDENILFLLVIFFTAIFMFAFLAPYIIGDSFSVRYLIIAALAGFFMIGLFIQSLDERLLFRQFGVVALFVSIACMDLYSDYFLAISDNSAWCVDELLSAVEKTDAGLVYFWDNGKTLVQPERVIRVIDDSRVYKCVSNGDTLENFGDYKYYDDSTQYEGATVMVVLQDDIAAPENVMEQYELIDTIGDYGIYYCDNNPVDFKNMVSNWKE